MLVQLDMQSNAEMPPTQYLSVMMPEEYQLAYIHNHHPGNNTCETTGVVFLPGFMSSMRSTKPQSIFHFCQEHELEFTTLDYSCGEERWDEESYSISRWMQEALWILNEVTTSRNQILVGSSMGAWIMMLLAAQQECKKNIVGLVGIASAPDFTTSMSETIYSSDELSQQMERLGYCDLPTTYDDSGYYRIFQQFLKDAEEKQILGSPIGIPNIPVKLLHGTDDIDIHWSQSKELLSKTTTSDSNKELILIEGGDHRLSKPHELDAIRSALDDVLNRKNVAATTASAQK